MKESESRTCGEYSESTTSFVGLMYLSPQISLSKLCIVAVENVSFGNEVSWAGYPGRPDRQPSINIQSASLSRGTMLHARYK